MSERELSLVPSTISDASERGFLLRFVLLALGVVLIVAVLSLLPLDGALRYVVPGVAAVILALAYLRRPAEALLVFALLVLFSRSLTIWTGSAINQVDEIAVGLLVVAAFSRVWRRWREWIWLPRDITVAALFVLGVASSLLAAVPPAIWLMALVLLGKSIAFLYVVTWTRFEAWEIRAGMGALLALGGALLALGFVELLNPPAFHTFFGLPQLQRQDLTVMKSLFVHPVLFAWFMAFIALFAYAQFLTVRRWRWLAVAVVFSVGTFMATRRRAILALWTGLAAGFIESLRRIRRPTVLLRTWAPVAASALLVAVVFMPALSTLYQSTIQTYVAELPGVLAPEAPTAPVSTPAPGSSPHPAAEPEPSVVAGQITQARTALYVGSLDVARDYFPVGAGLGRYASWMSRVNYSPLYEQYGLSDIHGLRPTNPAYVTDTFWPQILGELGVLGLVAYLGFLGSIAYLLWREAGHADGPLMRVVVLGGGMVFVQALVESLASPMYHSPPRVYLLYLAVGVVVSLAWHGRAARAADTAQPS
jgi:hypothetical protein